MFFCPTLCLRTTPINIDRLPPQGLLLLTIELAVRSTIDDRPGRRNPQSAIWNVRCHMAGRQVIGTDKPPLCTECCAVAYGVAAPLILLMLEPREVSFPFVFGHRVSGPRLHGLVLIHSFSSQIYLRLQMLCHCKSDARLRVETMTHAQAVYLLIRVVCKLEKSAAPPNSGPTQKPRDQLYKAWHFPAVTITSTSHLRF